MTNLKYYFSYREDMIDILGVGIENTDKNYRPLMSLFTGTTASNYPRLIEGALTNSGYCTEVGGVLFPGDYEEWEEKKLPENMVRCNLFEEEVIIPRLDFLEVLLAAAREMLLIQKKSGNPSEDWTKTMEELIQKLDDYIKHPDFKL